MLNIAAPRVSRVEPHEGGRSPVRHGIGGSFSCARFLFPRSGWEKIRSEARLNGRLTRLSQLSWQYWNRSGAGCWRIGFTNGR